MDYYFQIICYSSAQLIDFLFLDAIYFGANKYLGSRKKKIIKDKIKVFKKFYLNKPEI